MTAAIRVLGADDAPRARGSPPARRRGARGASVGFMAPVDPAALDAYWDSSPTTSRRRAHVPRRVARRRAGRHRAAGAVRQAEPAASRRRAEAARAPQRAPARRRRGADAGARAPGACARTACSSRSTPARAATPIAATAHGAGPPSASCRGTRTTPTARSPTARSTSSSSRPSTRTPRTPIAMPTTPRASLRSPRLGRVHRAPRAQRRDFARAGGGRARARHAAATTGSPGWRGSTRSTSRRCSCPAWGRSTRPAGRPRRKLFDSVYALFCGIVLLVSTASCSRRSCIASCTSSISRMPRNEMTPGWTRRSRSRARPAQRGEVPVGAVVVRDGAIIGRGGNAPIAASDPTAHAEIAALRDAARATGNYRLPGCDALRHASSRARCAPARSCMRVSPAWCSAPRIRRPARAARSSTSSREPRLNHHAEVDRAACARDECGALLSDFFAARRARDELRPHELRLLRAGGLHDRPGGGRPRGARGSTELGHRVVRDATVDTRHAALRRARRRAPRRHPAHGRRSATWTSRARCAAATAGRACSTGSTTRRSRARGTRWLGHSDFTAFQLAALAQAGMVTFAGPMAAYDFGAEHPSAFTFEQCFGVLGHRDMGGRVPARRSRARRRTPACCGAATWRSSRTCAARRTCRTSPAASSCWRTSASIPYRVERMLYQLLHAGILARQRAVLLGAFTEYALTSNDDGYDLAAAVAHLRDAAAGADLHGPAVRPRARQADAAHRRALRHEVRRAARARLAFSDYP